jgi:hypothetical protein
MSTTETAQEMCKPAEPEKEHAWLKQLVGDWHMQAECNMGPGQPPMKSEAKEKVRTLGELWIVAEGIGTMPGGEPSITQLTLGFDPTTKRFVGTWVGSMMTHMWIYNGTLDSSGKVLTLDTEGPDFSDPKKRSKYQDIYEIVSDDQRVLKSRVQGANGEWTEFMTAQYRRVK